MRSHNLDDDTLRGVYAGLDIIRMYKLLHDRKLLPESEYGSNIVVDSDSAYYMKYEFVENNAGSIFGDYSEVSMHVVNEPETVIQEDFIELSEFYDYEEFPVNGITLMHPAIDMFIELCDKHNVNLQDSIFVRDVCKMDQRANGVSWGEYYTEIFVPETKLLDKYHLCIFYADTEWFNSYLMEEWYDLLDYIMDVVTHPKFVKEMLYDTRALESANK